MKELIGRIIKEIAIRPGEEAIAFGTDIGTICYVTYGDCCSETWFAEIIGVRGLLNSVVQTVEELDLPEVVDGKSRQESDQFYGVKLVTDKGTAMVVFRNSSNGYYGGNLNFAPDLVPADDWIVITDDWQANSPMETK